MKSVFGDLAPDKLLGESLSSHAVRSIFGEIEPAPPMGLSWGVELFKLGVSLDFRGENRETAELDTIILFLTPEAALDASDIQDYAVFVGDLPYGLTRNMSKSDVRSLLGEPEFVRNEIENEIAGFIPCAYQYEVAQGGKTKAEFRKGSLFRMVVHKER